MITSLQIGQNKIQIGSKSGSNANGNYLIEPDGTCEQWGEFSMGAVNGLTSFATIINLPLEMNDANYYVYRISQRVNGGWTSNIRQTHFERYVDKLSLSIFNGQTDATRNTTIFQWRIKGQVKDSVRDQLFGE